jgi:uncharacterized protein (DUF1778 family)
MMAIRVATVDGRRAPKRARPVTATNVERSITAKVSPKIYAAFERAANTNGLTVSGFARAIIEATVERYK